MNGLVRIVGQYCILLVVVIKVYIIFVMLRLTGRYVPLVYLWGYKGSAVSLAVPNVSKYYEISIGCCMYRDR